MDSNFVTSTLARCIAQNFSQFALDCQKYLNFKPTQYSNPNKNLKPCGPTLNPRLTLDHETESICEEEKARQLFNPFYNEESSSPIINFKIPEPRIQTSINLTEKKKADQIKNIMREKLTKRKYSTGQRPKRPKNAFNFYLQENLTRFQQQFPSLAPTVIISKIAEEYRSLTEQKKQVYINKYLQDKKKFDIKREEFFQKHPEMDYRGKKKRGYPFGNRPEEESKQSGFYTDFSRNPSKKVKLELEDISDSNPSMIFDEQDKQERKQDLSLKHYSKNLIPKEKRSYHSNNSDPKISISQTEALQLKNQLLGLRINSFKQDALPLQPKSHQVFVKNQDQLHVTSNLDQQNLLPKQKTDEKTSILMNQIDSLQQHKKNHAKIKKHVMSKQDDKIVQEIVPKNKRKSSKKKKRDEFDDIYGFEDSNHEDLYFDDDDEEDDSSADKRMNKIRTAKLMILGIEEAEKLRRVEEEKQFAQEKKIRQQLFQRIKKEEERKMQELQADKQIKQLEEEIQQERERQKQSDKQKQEAVKSKKQTETKQNQAHEPIEEKKPSLQPKVEDVRIENNLNFLPATKSRKAERPGHSGKKKKKSKFQVKRFNEVDSDEDENEESDDYAPQIYNFNGSAKLNLRNRQNQNVEDPQNTDKQIVAVQNIVIPKNLNKELKNLLNLGKGSDANKTSHHKKENQKNMDQIQNFKAPSESQKEQDQPEVKNQRSSKIYIPKKDDSQQAHKLSTQSKQQKISKSKKEFKQEESNSSIKSSKNKTKQKHEILEESESEKKVQKLQRLKSVQKKNDLENKLKKHRKEEQPKFKDPVFEKQEKQEEGKKQPQNVNTQNDQQKRPKSSFSQKKDVKSKEQMTEGDDSQNSDFARRNLKLTKNVEPQVISQQVLIKEQQAKNAQKRDRMKIHYEQASESEEQKRKKKKKSKKNKKKSRHHDVEENV